MTVSNNDKHHNLATYGFGERAPWGDFPPVLRNGNLGSLKRESEYDAAKSGDERSALALINRLVSDQFARELAGFSGDRSPVLLPVLSEEQGGNNKIPLAMAEVLHDRLGWPVELGIIQREKVGRTNSGADHRLAFTPTFEGEVVEGSDYLVLDDTLTMGGTIACLRGFVLNRGGNVLSGAVMTAHEGAVDLAVKPKMLYDIEQKHGSGMNSFWKDYFGYGIDKLTQGEAGHLKAAQSVDAIRERIIEARHEGLFRLDAQRTETHEDRKEKGSSAVRAPSRKKQDRNFSL